MRPSDEDPEVCSTLETETTQTTEESDTSATAAFSAAQRYAALALWPLSDAH